jgi:hypothetical protein
MADPSGSVPPVTPSPRVLTDCTTPPPKARPTLTPIDPAVAASAAKKAKFARTHAEQKEKAKSFVDFADTQDNALAAGGSVGVNKSQVTTEKENEVTFHSRRFLNGLTSAVCDLCGCDRSSSSHSGMVARRFRLFHAKSTLGLSQGCNACQGYHQ